MAKSTTDKKMSLSSSQKEAIRWVKKDGDNSRFFYPFNCYLKKQTVDSLFKKGIVKKCSDNSQYMELTELGKSIEL